MFSAFYLFFIKGKKYFENNEKIKYKTIVKSNVIFEY